MSPAQLRKDARAEEHFRREALATSLVESQHVVPVEGVGIDAATKQPWILLQLLDGETLDAKVTPERARSTDTARDLARQLGHALKAAHRVGVIHRDLEPDNLFLARREDVQQSVVLKVLDFGLAGIINPDESRVQSTRVAGSLAWSAPEQGESGARMGPEVDVWPLGLLAFWMLTGRHYWRAMNADGVYEAQLMREIAFDPLDASRGDDRASARASRYKVEGRIPQRDRRLLATVVAALAVTGAAVVWRVVRPDDVRPSRSRAPACPAGMTLDAREVSQGTTPAVWPRAETPAVRPRTTPGGRARRTRPGGSTARSARRGRARRGSRSRA